jgi:hypothetical protein
MSTATADSLLCPLCDYDLRGQVEPLCPECGYTFQWEDLRDPSRRKHKYLFEHHPEQNVRSFLRTLLGGLRPRKFWGGLLPSQPSRPRRLRIYAFMICLSILLPSIAFTLGLLHAEWSVMAENRRVLITRMNTARTGFAPNPTLTPRYIDHYAPAPTLAVVMSQSQSEQAFKGSMQAHAFMLLWPVLSLVSLMIFQVSMRRARVRPIHFARCVVYCADVFLWGNALIAASVVALPIRRMLLGKPHSFPRSDYNIAATFITGAVLLIFMYRLIIAFKKYLRFDHPISTILATQFIVLLTMMVIFVIAMSP